MHPDNRKKLQHRVASAAHASVAAKGYVSPLDVLIGIGWVDAATVKRWRQGQVDCLERVVRSNLSRISEAMKLFRAWARDRGLRPSETQYVSHTPRRQTLRFSRSGDHTVERLYRTHYVSPALSTQKRERLAALASPPPGGDAGTLSPTQPHKQETPDDANRMAR